MATIDVYFMHVLGNKQMPFYHESLLYTDDKRDQSFIRGGPSSKVDLVCQLSDKHNIIFMASAGSDMQHPDVVEVFKNSRKDFIADLSLRSPVDNPSGSIRVNLNRKNALRISEIKEHDDR